MGKQGSRGQNLAAKKRRRAVPTSKPAGTPSLTPRWERYVFPTWQHPSAARTLVEQMPGLTHSDALALILAEPVNWQSGNGRIGSLVPADVITETGESVDTFIASIEVLHEIGSFAWDDTRRVHIQTFPDDDPIGPLTRYRHFERPR